MFAKIIAAAADYEQSNRTHLRWERQFGYAAAQNLGHLLTGAVRGRPSVNREYSAICTSAGYRRPTLAHLRDDSWPDFMAPGCSRLPQIPHRRNRRARPCLAGPHRSPTSPASGGLTTGGPHTKRD